MALIEKLKVGIAGFGVVGKRRRQCIEQHPRLEVVGLADRAFGENHTAKDGVRNYVDFHQLIEKEKLDVLFVCLTNDVAAEATSLGLQSGAHVFCEKPPSRNLEELAQVGEISKRHPRLKLKYGFNHRYHDSVRDAMAIIEKGSLGKLINLRGVYGKSQMITFGAGDWRTKRAIAGGGILMDQGIHMVDMMRLFGGEFTEIHSCVSNSFWQHDVEDNAYALMRTQSGIVAMLHSSATLWRHRFQLEMALSRGSIELSGILSGSKSYGEETITIAYVGKNDQGVPREQTTRYNQDNSWSDEVNEFADAILFDRPIVHGTFAEAQKTLELVTQIYKADPRWREATGRAVPFAWSVDETAPLDA